MKCDGTHAETRFLLSMKRTSPFKSARTSVQSTTGSRGVRLSGSNAGYTMFRGSVKGTGYPFHSPVSPSLPRLCVTVCHHISTGVYTDSHKTGQGSVYCAFMWRAVVGRSFQCSHISLSLIISRTLSGNSLSEGDWTLLFPSLCEIPRV